MIDIDKIPAPPGVEPDSDPDFAIDHVLAMLPPEFADATCWWQWSSSQGIVTGPKKDEGPPPTLSVHLWFWLDRPIADAELERWARHTNRVAGLKLIDTQLFNAIQPHYTAAPIFDDDLVDPLPRRSGLRRGCDDRVAIVLPERDAPRSSSWSDRRSSAGTRGPAPRSGGGLNLPISFGFDDALGQIGDGPGLDGFHQPIKRAIASYIATHYPEINLEWLKRQLRDAIAGAPVGTDRAGSDLVRYASDHYLDSIIQWVLAQEESKKAQAERAHAQPFYPEEGADADMAAAQLEAAIADFFDRSI
jgi:hypothetical protein